MGAEEFELKKKPSSTSKTPNMFPATLSVFRDRGQRVPMNNPLTIAPITTPIDTNNPAHFTLIFASCGYAPSVYMYRLSGRNPIDAMLDTVVIATDSDRSPLNRDVHQLL